MKSDQTLKKILWAIDPQPKFLKYNKRLLKSLSLFFAERGVIVQPVFVMSPDIFQIEQTFSVAFSQKLELAVLEESRNLLKKFEQGGVRPLKILRSTKPGQDQAALLLSRFARSQRAQCIVTLKTSPDYEGRGAGSFTQSLLFKSKTPLLVVPSDRLDLSALKTIVFATDFSTSSRKAFAHVLRYAKHFSAKVIVYHKIVSNMSALIQSGVYIIGGGWITSTPMSTAERKNAQKNGADFLNLARQSKVPAKLTLKGSDVSLIDELTSLSKKKGVMVALGSESGKFESRLIGSVALSLLETSNGILWIDRSQAK